MKDFFLSRAGKQFLSLVALGTALWGLGYELSFHESLFRFVNVFKPYGADKLVLAIAVGGAMSFIYSILRVYDLRKEMELRTTAQARADWAATHDHLTKLPNRYAFERATLPLRRTPGEDEERTVTVFSVDLDGFKKVNDLVGHKGGDALLIEVARRLCSLGKADCVFRFGGDEFLIAAIGLPESHQGRFAQMLIQAVTRPIHIDGFAVEVGASVGFATWREGRERLDEAAHRADLAMYEAKSGGPNRHCAFETAMQDKVTERASLEAKLRLAIQEKAICTHYQPLINLRTGAICGFEALARWTDSQGVFIPPPVFIAIAEETGLITELFENLLAQACGDALAWPEDIILSFNVSPVQMEDRLLASRILRILDATKLPARRLEIEITENALIQDPVDAARILDELTQAGVQVALDDFGTGYSSLSQLARYRFDKIKIDKSLISTYQNDERQDKIVRAMLGLGRSLNIKTSAEGIEEHGQLSHLLLLGCDIGQGYIFGKAMPAEQALDFINDRREALTASA